LSHSKSNAKIREDLYLIAFSVHIEELELPVLEGWQQCGLRLGSVSMGCGAAPHAKAVQTNRHRRYTEGKSRRITVKSMDVYIERRVATEAVRLKMIN
jgi:hypothetical protein